MWTVSFRQNTEQPGRGTFVATFDGAFSFSRDQVDANDPASVAAFVAAAKTAFAEVAAKQVEVAAIVAAVEVELNKV